MAAVRSRFAALAALAALGCGTRDPLATLEACRDDSCRLAALPAAWDDDPDAAWAFLLAQGDPLAQATLVSNLAAQRPGALEGRCVELLHKSAQKRCMRLTRRPHLRSTHQRMARKDAGEKRAAPGPGSAALPLPPNPMTLPAPRCPELGLSECAFISAERAVLARGLAALEEALGLCALSDHGPDCVEHVLELAIPPVPPADAMAQGDIDLAIACADRFGEAAADPRVASLYEDWFWSVWTTTAFAQARELHGELLVLLPPAAQPQLRFALTYATLQRREPSDGLELEPLAEAALAAMARREPLPEHSGHRVPATIAQTRHTWAGERPEERAVPAAYCMGSTRRAAHADPAVDLRLAVLEALARQPQPPSGEAFLALVATDELEIVRWTGARLGTLLDPEAGYALGDSLGEVETPLVLGRLSRRPGKRSTGSPPQEP